jgi:hypothetical protein
MAEGWRQGYWRDDIGVLLLSTGAGVVGSPRWYSGYRLDASNYLVCTASLTGAAWRQGYLRDPSGALVYVPKGSAVGMRWYSGYVIDANGALVIGTGAGTWQHGFLRDAGGILIGTVKAA